VEYDKVNGDEEEWISRKADDTVFVRLIAVFALRTAIRVAPHRLT
jgi:hypothetical protein